MELELPVTKGGKYGQHEVQVSIPYLIQTLTWFCRQNILSHAHFSQCRALDQIITRTCVWLKFGMCYTFAHLKSHPLTTCFIDHSLMCLTHFLPFCSAPPSTSQTPMPMTGIRRSPFATSHGGFQFGRLVEHNSHRFVEKSVWAWTAALSILELTSEPA